MNKQTILNLENLIIESQKHLKIDEKKQELLSLKELSSKDDFWKNQDSAKKILMDIKKIENLIKPWDKILKDLYSLKELFLLNEQAQDFEFEKELEKDFEKIEEEYKKLNLTLLFKKKEDNLGAYLTIQSGAGGTEACDWANMLFRMYLRFCEKSNYKTKILDMLENEGGIKSATFEIEGENAFGYLKGENGVHRLVRISPFDANKKRHTSFASIFVIPRLDENIDINLEEKDLKIDTYRSSGAGGQSVNTTDSAVRITHLPTNIIVTCQNERSQLKNKETALKILKSRVYEHELSKKQDEKQKLEDAKSDIAWGNQIRSYVFQPYMLVKDNRTNYEEHDIEKVMDGDIKNFLVEYLKKYEKDV